MTFYGKYGFYNYFQKWNYLFITLWKQKKENLLKDEAMKIILIMFFII